MRIAAPLLLFVVVSIPSLINAQTATLRQGNPAPEDPKIRAEAVGLLERANRASTPAVWPPNQMRLHFHVPDPEPGYPPDGDYTYDFGGPTLRRKEWNYGAFQYVQTRNGLRLNMSNTRLHEPAVLELLPKLTPIFLVHFDQEDIIRAIVPGPDGSRCIQFDTVFGDRQQSNEICVDGQNGWLLSIKVGNEYTRNSNFFEFHGVYLPGHIERWVDKTMLIEVDQQVTEVSAYPPEYFKVPEKTNGFVCTDFRHATPIDTPQPQQLNSSDEVLDVALLGSIGADGHVIALALRPANQLHPDLNEEAIRLVSTWTFAPATCAGKPVGSGATFVVHFKGRQ